ncbi:hypothetical protein [Sphaerisporangium perillae]|uniref:hypothetical protein n=1 Tax=Sphaerisporangium perillae TaxID=2935860 RepID=UPI00200CBD77|nr:hypothetical protein [Sphaerisporangium perillae]
MTQAQGPGAPGGPLDLDEIRAQVRREVTMAGDRAFESPPRGGSRPPRVMTEVEQHGVSPTDNEARSPLGVGTSTSARAEKIAQREEEAGRKKIGVEGPARRPVGVSTPEHGTGVGAQSPVHPGSPYMPPGDQAG